MRLIFAVFVWVICLSQSAFAQNNPVLTATDYEGPDGKVTDLPMDLADMDITIDISASIATVTVTAVFYNPLDDDFEADFEMQLPQDAIVTGYGLDIDGVLTDGILEEASRATTAYEDRVRAGIDPGLGEIQSDNRFRTRVYPVFAESQRIISLTFTSPVPENGLFIPLSRENVTSKITRSVQSLDGSDVSAEFVGKTDDDRNGLLVTVSETPPVVLTQHSPGDHFAVVSLHPSTVPGSMPGLGPLSVIWDVSASRQDGPSPAEIAALRTLTAGQPDFDLYFLSEQLVAKDTVTDADMALSLIANAPYEGATRLGALENLPYESGQSCLLFTDGRNTYGPTGLFQNCHYFPVVEAPDADRAYLRLLAQSSGGHVYDLSQSEVTTLHAPRPVTRVTDSQGEALSFAEIDDQRLVIKIPEDTSQLRIEHRGSLPVTVSITSSTPVVTTKSAGQIWAAQELTRLRAIGAAHSDLIDFSRDYSVLSDLTRFLVLETWEEYAELGFDLPESLQEEMGEEYAEYRREIMKQTLERETAHLDYVLELWQDQITWWNTDYPTDAPKPAKDAQEATGESRGEPAAEEATDVIVPPLTDGSVLAESEPADEVVVTGGGGGGFEGDEEIVVTGSRIRRDDSAQTVPILILEDFNLEPTIAEYLETVDGIWLEPTDAGSIVNQSILDARGDGALSEGYDAARSAYGTLPVFYLDAADLFYEQGNTDRAVTVVISALDMASASDSTAIAVAERLRRFGAYDEALIIWESLAERQDFRPQPLRAWALTLIARGDNTVDSSARLADYQRALELLLQVILTPWEEDYQGVEMVALMEANHLIAKIEALGGDIRAIPETLIALLPVDIRILIEWNSDNTDMDLWVTDPAGETVKYDNPLSHIGGKISDDMTEGYGPEEFLLKTAVPGDYRIDVDYFGSDAINPNGDVVVSVTVIRNWGKPSETRQERQISFASDEEDTYEAGLITIAE